MTGKPVTDVNLYVAQQIAIRRESRGITQKELGQSIGVTYQQMHKYEIGQNRITSGRLVHIAYALGCQVADFFPSLDQPVTLEPRQRSKRHFNMMAAALRIPEARLAMLCQMTEALAGEAR